MPQLASYWLAVSFSCDVMMMSLARKFGPRPWKDDTASDGREVYRVEPPTIVKVGARLGPGKATLDPVCHPPPPSPWGAGPHGFFLTAHTSFSSKRRLEEKVSWEFQVFTLCGDTSTLRGMLLTWPPFISSKMENAFFFLIFCTFHLFFLKILS